VYLFSDAGDRTELTSLAPEELRRIRPRIQMIFQDPYRSLNPRMRVGEIITEPLSANGRSSRAEIRSSMGPLLEQVGLSPTLAERYPHAFSGGQRQRIGIARALATQPDLIICDEPVSGLDVSVQAQILNLLQDLRDTLSLSYLFISHDLAVVRSISDRVLVMYEGAIVEESPTDALYSQPLHPYTSALLASALSLVPGDLKTRNIIRTASVARSPRDGCPFSPRCPHCVDRCVIETPMRRELFPGRTVACHRAEELDLTTSYQSDRETP